MPAWPFARRQGAAPPQEPSPGHLAEGSRLAPPPAPPLAPPRPCQRRAPCTEPHHGGSGGHGGRAAEGRQPRGGALRGGGASPLPFPFLSPSFPPPCPGPPTPAPCPGAASMVAASYRESRWGGGERRRGTRSGARPGPAWPGPARPGAAGERLRGRERGGRGCCGGAGPLRAAPTRVRGAGPVPGPVRVSPAVSFVTLV